MVGPYFTRASFLHGRCFYYGLCEPVEVVEEDLRETADYLRKTEELASAG